MTDAALTPGGPSPVGHKLDQRPPVATRIVFLTLLVVGLGYCGWSVRNDITGVGETVAFGVFALLGLALLIALGFEFVNGFHDTANAVATVIYTNSLPPVVAVIYSGTLNFVGVMTSTGAVAFTIVTLLPVELILQVGSTAGYAMIFALLLAAIVWNLGTWWFGIPNSSSHALIGSIMGVGLANQLMAPRPRSRRPAASTGRRRPRCSRRCCFPPWSASAPRPSCCCSSSSSSAPRRSIRSPRLISRRPGGYAAFWC